MSTLFVDHLTVIDCSYLDKARGLVGESWIVDLQLTGELDAQSMVLDFGQVKKTIKRLIDDTVDHKLLVPEARASQHADNTEAMSTIEFVSDRGMIRHTSPADALCWLPGEDITVAAVERYLITEIQRVVPANVAQVALSLRTEEIQGAYYHYSHGLKKHDGNCQRIAHGHRSRIGVFCEQQRQPELEQQIAEQWRDIYIGSRADLQWQRDGQLHFAYHAPQGDFAITLPEAVCYLIESDSTVECIAEYLATTFSQQTGNTIQVKAYEGVRKGAIATCEAS